MKAIKQILIFSIVILGTQCMSQNPIINLEDWQESIDNAYYKDGNQLLDPFVGTWMLDNGSQYLKIVFEKKEMIYNGNYYEDLLIGEFAYKENGIELANTLYKLNSLLPDPYKHSIEGNHIPFTQHSPFEAFTPDIFRLSLIMSEPNGASSNLYLRTAEVNGQEAIQIFKRGGTITKMGEDPGSLKGIIPRGYYYLIKQ
ncbi:DUF6705 family protein [Mangrovimonas sp. ST2L15]|uniref:DUF6705 family protein n=1 Tax=Mangrovimonas sp. ST2L15 TaxID=1645916 RepID=UPI000AA22CDF